MDIVGCCFGGCVCFLTGMCCKVMFCDENKDEKTDEENAPAANGVLPYPPQNPITNQPTSMPMPSTDVGMPRPMPNTDVGWNMSRPQDQPYPELNSNCPYPPLLPNPLQNLTNLSVASNIPQPTAPASTSTSSEHAQDCPPKYEDAINLIKN